MKKQVLYWGLCFFVLSGVKTIAQENTASKNPGDTTVKYKPVEIPTGYLAEIDAVYKQVNDWNGRMDIYYNPENKNPTPLIINIHGGGWKNGVKEAQGGFNTYFKAGFAVANVEYRLTPQATAPAAIEDCRCALIYMIKNASKYNIDKNKIVVMGGSAGGHLALMTGLLGNNSLFDNDCGKNKEKIKVAAIIDKYGITDVWDWAYGVRKSKSATQWLASKQKDEAFVKSVSPVSYLKKDIPPVFILHGDADSSVPYQQSVDLHQKLEALGVRNEFMTIPGGGHGKFDKETNANINKSIMNFLMSIEALKD